MSWSARLTTVISTSFHRGITDMSTKIYTGCRLAEGVDIFDFTAKLRETFRPIYDDIVTQFTVLSAATLIQNARFVQDPLPADPLWAGFNRFNDIEQDTSFRITEFTASFQRDVVTGRIFARPFMDALHYEDAWFALPEVEHYGYWNNTDKPKDVTDAEWVERREAWDRLFGWDPVSENSLTFTLVEFGPPPHRMLAFPKNGLLFPRDPDKHRALVSSYMTLQIHGLGVSLDDLLGSTEYED
jgi:hypothetical protein